MGEGEPGAEHLVVIAGDVGDLGAVAGVSEDEAEDLVVGGVPVPGFAEAPSVDDVADEEELVAGHATEEVGEEVGAASPGAQMGVGDEHGAVVRRVVARNKGVHAIV